MQCSYGHLLYNGSGVAQDKKKAAEYYKIAAQKNNADVLMNYAWKWWWNWNE